MIEAVTWPDYAVDMVLSTPTLWSLVDLEI